MLLVLQLVLLVQVALLLALVLVPDAQGLMAADQVRLLHLVAMCCEETALQQLQCESMMPPVTAPHRCYRRRALEVAVDCNEALVLLLWPPQCSS